MTELKLFVCMDGFSLDTTIVRAEDTLEAKKIMYQEYLNGMEEFGEREEARSFADYIKFKEPYVEEATNEGKGVVKRVIQYS